MTFTDPYLDPDSGILRNLPRIDDPEDLAQFEAHAVALRSQQLHVNADIIEPTWDARHWKAVHRHLFQDVYDWAGVFRAVDITRGDHTVYPADRIDLAVDHIAGQLRTISGLEAPTIDELAEPLAVVLGDMNEAHPFRDGGQGGRRWRER